ncbi:MAG: hypothetical protein GY904_06285 [Planctomycetaceae bacterium]|nr:hypothetical protein [Planctomycetaceae bacterium]
MSSRSIIGFKKRPRRKHRDLRLSFRRRLEQLEHRLLLTACPGGAEPIAGDYNLTETALPLEISAPICFEGSINIDVDQPITINAEVISTTGSVSLTSTQSLMINQAITSDEEEITLDSNEEIIVGAALQAAKGIEIKTLLPLNDDTTTNRSITINAAIASTMGSIDLSSDQSLTINGTITSDENAITLDANDEITITASLQAADEIELTSEQTIQIAANVVSSEGGLTFDADDEITIGATLQSAGEIEITSHKSIDVSADILSSGGEITLEAVHKRLNFGISALDQIQDLLTLGSGQLEVTIGNESNAVLISGAEGVSITAEAGINDKYNIGANTYFKNIYPVVMELLGKPDLFTLPVSVQVWNPSAEVTTQNATLVSEGGEITVSAIAEANAKGKAVWNRVVGTGEKAGEGRGFDKGGGAAGFFFTDATATVDILDTVISGDGVEVSSEVKNEIELEVNAVTNNGLSNTNPSSVAIGFGLTDLRTTSTVHVDQNSLISSSGNVKVEATGEDDNSNSVKATAYRDGVVGAAAGFTYTDGTISAVVDGKITMSHEIAAEESETSPEALDFNPALQVDFTNSSVQFTGTTDYETADAVLFTSADSGTIPGLIPDTVYYLIVTSDTTNETYQLQFAATAEDATNNEPIPFGAAFPSLTNARTNVTAPITITVIDSEGRHLILFGYDETLAGESLYENGDAVTYTSTVNRFLGYEDQNNNLVAPLAEGSYTVATVDSPFEEQYPLAIELIDNAGNPIALNGASYLQSASGTLYPISSYNSTEDSVDLSTLEIDSSANEVIATPPAVPVQQGESLVFHPGLNNSVTTLEKGVTYYAIVDTSNEGIIQLASTPSQAESSNPAVQNAQASLTAEVDGQTVTIPIGNFEMGLGLTFSEDPNIPDGTSVVYNAVAQKPINGLIDQATYVAYNVNNVNANPAVPQYIIALVDPAAVELSTTADSGTFTLTVTDAEGGQGITGPIAWNAASDDLNEAIDALQLPGVSVAVSGFGTSQSPWLIEGLGDDDITIDSSQLSEGGSAATVTLQQAGMGIVLNSDAVSGTFTMTYTDPALSIPGEFELSITADSGTFTLTVTDSLDTSETTNLIDWDASPSELAAAINALPNSGGAVSVSGSGTSLSPWLITGMGDNEITIDSSLLSNGDSAASASLETAKQSFATAPLAWNATPAQVATALNALPNLAVSVSGMGNAISPWRIQGLLPSEVTVDSTSLINRFQQEATVQMTSDLQAAFWIGQTFQADGDSFTLTGANIDENTLTLLLTDEAPVVSADGASLENGSVTFSSVGAGATQMFSFADSGTFTLTITNPRTGAISTTDSIAWNANASTVAAKITDSSGISVEVNGSGSIQSPWLISGMNADQLDVNSDSLLKGTTQTNLFYRSTSYAANVVTTDADGGTFTLTFSVDGETVESNPIAYDATAGEVTDVLRASLSSVSVEVFGRGTEAEPWVIIGLAQPIETGDALTFNDSWDLQSLGLLNGQTYYAVINPQALDADMLIVGLAGSVADAMADPPVLLSLSASLDLITGPSTIMTGAEESLTAVPEALELEISTELESGDAVTASAGIGGRPMLGYYTDGAKSAKSRWFSKEKAKGPSAIDHEISERTPEHLADKVNRFSATFGVSILDVKNDVQSVIGNTATIGVEGNVAVKSDLTEKIHASANAGLAKRSSNGASAVDYKESSAVAVATVVAVLNNSSQAVIESDAEVTGTEGVEVASEITYPRRDSIPGSDGGGWDEAYGIIKSLALNPTVNAVESWFFNTSTNVGIKGVGSEDSKRLDWILTGSVIVQDITNRNLAQIADGAQINQSTSEFSWYDAATDMTLQTADLGELEESNGVSIEAKSDMTQWGIAGQLYIGLDLLTLGTADLANNVLPFKKSSRNAFGGSANFVIISEQTRALLGGVDPDGNTPQNTSTNVKYGGGEEEIGLSVQAETVTKLLEISQSAASSSGFGIEASTTYLLMGENEENDADRGQFTYAELNSANLPIELTPISGTAGEVLVEAADSSDLWAISGAVMLGSTKGIGVSASVVELNRDAAAGVGSRTTTGTPKSTNRKQAGGNFTIDAAIDGTIMPMALVGAISASRNSPIGGDGKDTVPADGSVGAASSIDGKWGLGISGDFSGAFVDDQVQSYLNSPGTLSGIESEGTELNMLEISAKNESIMNPIGGQATISIARGRSGAMAGIAGSASVAEYQSHVTATLENVNIESLGIDVKALNEKRIGTCAAGLQVQAPKGADLQIAGSVVVNEITNHTIASLKNVFQTEGLGEVGVSALQLDEIWGGAGTAAVTYDRRSDRPKAKTAVGVGMSAVWNGITNTTTAEVVDSNLNQNEGGFDVTAEDFTSSRVLSAGVNVAVPSGVAIEIGGMWATNYVSPSTTAQITGSTIENVTTDDPMDVVAVLAPYLDSFAGYFSLEFGKPLSTKETQLGVGVGAAVIVNRLGPQDANDAALPTLAQVSNSNINRAGDLTVRAYTGALDDQTSSFVPNQELAESLVGEQSLHALAIAGSAQGENSADSFFSAGIVVNGAVVVTDLKINTKATVTTNSSINEETSVGESTSTVEVLATNQLTVSTDAGGASVSESVSLSGTSVDIAVGGADNSFNSWNETTATIADNSSVIAESLEIAASHAPEIDNIAFGVAVSVAVSTSMFGAAFGFSGAFLQVDQSDVVQAAISDSKVEIRDTITLQADDQSSMTTGSGSGSLQVSYGSGAAVSLAPSAVTNKVTVGNLVLAWIGDRPLTDGTLVDSSVTADGSSISAGAGITVAATCDQEIRNNAIAVAVSVSVAPDFASAAGAGSGASSTITTNNIIKSAVNGVSDLTVGGSNGLSVTASDSGSNDITVGTAAASIGWFGASIGISLAELVNNDQVVAEIQNSDIKTSSTISTGTPVEIIATDTVELTTDAVATSLSISIGASGAGGKSNITSNAEVAASLGDGSTVTAMTGYAPGDLKINADSKETLLAEIFGGSAGLGSVGVFNSDAIRAGSTMASIDTAGAIDVNDLSLIASADQSVISQGMSVTVGGLAGTGENHNVTVSESVTTTLQGQNQQLNVVGNLLVTSHSTNSAIARTSGSGGQGEDISASLMGVGFFKVNSDVSPSVSLQVSDVKLDVQGTATFDARASNSNNTESKSGSGSLVGGDAAKAITTNSPDVGLTIERMNLTSSGPTTVSGSIETAYSTNANSVYATAYGGSAARSYNTSEPALTVSIGTEDATASDTTIQSSGTVNISASNTLLGIGDGNSKKAAGFMARVGAGGGVSGFGGTANSTTNGSSTIELNDHVSIESTGNGNIQVSSINDWQSTQLTHLGTGGAINGAGVQSILDSTLNNAITLGSDVEMIAPQGEIGIGTRNYSATTSNADSYTFGLAGGSNSDSSNKMNSTQAVTIGSNSILHAGRDIVVTAGYDPSEQQGTLLDVYAVVTARCAGLLEIPTTTADASATVNNTVTIEPGTSIVSHADVELGAVPGINNASWYTFANIDGAKGKVHQGSDGLTESNTVTFDGEVIAGNMNELSVVIPSSGDSISVNDLVNEPIGESTITVQTPVEDTFDASAAFLPFQVARNPNYDATQLLDGLDATSRAILESSISDEGVIAIELTDLAALGGQAVLYADTLNGSGSVTANVPSISISNSSSAYLILGEMGESTPIDTPISTLAANTLNMGQVNIIGGAGRPAAMTFNQTSAVPEIVISQTYGESLPGSSAGPAIAIQKDIINTAGSVQITNVMGALVQTAPINAKSVSISTPNSAYIVSTPDEYYGSSGEIIDYWTPGSSLSGEGTFESPSTSSYIYNPASTNWTFSGSAGVSTNNSGFTSNNPDAPQGTQVAFIQERGQISQYIDSMTDGMSYVMQFQAAQREGYPDQSVEIALDGQSLCTITPTSTSYERYTCSFEVPAREPVDEASLRLTDGVSDTATAFWYEEQIELPASGTISIDFTYQAGGDKAADGIALAFQNTGVNAIGNPGGALGYVGIASPTAAYQINLYNGHVQGSNFVTTNTSGTYLPTGPVDFNSGNEIRVQLLYNADTNSMTETLTDSTTNASYSTTHDNIDLRDLLGASTYIGFTGADGGATSTQTVGNFAMTIRNSNTPTEETLVQGFGDWEINGNRFLTVTGQEPNGVDETVFIDELVLSTNPAGFVPGLNSYVTDYTANLAATTAATVLYIEESNANGNDGTFSSWLYNTGNQHARVNYDVSPGNVGGNYPKKAKDNYGSTQNGSGIIFFGSQIPYLWEDAPGTTVLSGSENLTDGLGYLDKLDNAQTYSKAASGNAADFYKNVTQGTGPQNDNASPGRGIFPVLPANFPTSVSVSNPASRSLGGSGITAGSLDITALFLDINGPINVGAVNQSISVVLGTELSQQISNYQTAYENGTETSSTMNINSYFGDSGMTGYYDAAAMQIVLDPYAINAGKTEAVFTGAIISTTQFGEINVHSDPGDITITNQTDYPLTLATIAASDQEVAGIVVMNDTITNQSTAYVYNPKDEVRIYQGDLHADIDEMTLVKSASTDSASFQPGSEESYVAGSVSSAELAYQWETDAWISRDLYFSVNSSGEYDLQSATNNNDFWTWGPAGSSAKNTTVETNPFPSTSTLLLTNGQEDDATAYWHPDKFSSLDENFSVKFTYQASGDRAADGITFAFQNEGARAVGQTGGGLGYDGISGPTAAYQINLYEGHVQGSNFVTTNTSGNYLSTDPVDFNSGNPIRVELSFDTDANTVQETLTDLTANTSYSYTHQNVDLASLLGSSAFVGFTGGDGGATSIQTVTDFSLDSSAENLAGFASWNDLQHQQILTQNTQNNLTQTVRATVTQTETATTHFDDSTSGSWDMGPSTTWTWTYPTEILLQIVNQVPAANPIDVDFGWVRSGGLTVNSNEALELAGNIIFPGSVRLSSTKDLTQAPNAVVAADQLTLISDTGKVGEADTPIQIEINSSTATNTTAESGIYLSSNTDFYAGQLIASDGPVEVTTAGDLMPGSNETNMQGSNIVLNVENGSIGTQAAPLTIQTQVSQLESGTVTDGLLSATAENGIFLIQPQGDLRLLSVTTSSSLGVVSISTEDGDITDGNTSDVFNLNQLTREQAEELIEQIKNVQLNTASVTVTAFEASVDQNYLQYWTLLCGTSTSDTQQPCTTANGSYDEQTGKFVLNDTGVAYYQSQANLYYTEQAQSETEVTATESQVQDYGNTLYQNSVTVFQDSLVFGLDWADLPQFQNYDPAYTFSASEVVVEELTYGAEDLSNSFAILSLTALGPQGTAVLGPINPAIKTTVLNLDSAGSVGLPFHVIEIDYEKLQQDKLSNEEKAILTQATAAGELQIVGVNQTGQRVVYPSGSRPDNVTPVAILVRIDKPIFVDLAENGLAQVQADNSINLTEVTGNLNLLHAETPEIVKFVSQADIINVPVNMTTSTTGWSSDKNGVLGYTDNDLNYTATDFTLGSPVFSTGMIENGSFESPVQTAGGFSYTPSSLGWNFSGLAGISENGSGFTNDNPVAPLGNQIAFIQEQGMMSQDISGLVAGQSYTLQFDVAQRNGYPAPTFTVDLDGQQLTTQTPISTAYETVSIPFTLDTTSLELTDGQDNEANAYWYQTPLILSSTGQFTVDFTYQAAGDAAADGITFAFQKEGTQALGGSGGSLGYVGISGPTAAYQINLYDGHQRGSNFVTTNTSESYLPTSPIDFNSGNPIQVQLVFDADRQTVTETLTDTVEQTTFSRTYTGIDLATLLNENAYIGFTGGDGGASSIQTVTDFKLWREDQSNSPIISGFGGWQFTGQHTLTFKGVDASLVDQTAFLDDVKITRSSGVISGDLRLVSGGDIGSSSVPMNVQVGGRLDLFATGDLYLTHSASNNLRLNAIYAGGNSMIEAPTSNVFAVQNFFKGSIAGFGIDGTGQGWEIDSVEGSVSFADDVLTLQNEAAPTEASETWHSNAATLFDTPVTIENRLISSFIYKNAGSDSDLSFVLASADTDVQTLAETKETNIANTFALMIENQCEGCSTSHAIGAAYGDEFQLTPVPDELGLSSGDPIEVLMIYEALTETASVTLTNAGNSFTFNLPRLDLLKILGTNQAHVGFVAQGNGQASTQEITGFSFAYGAPTVETNELTINSGQQIGAPQNPILILALGSVQSSAPNGVYLTQISGDLLVESATSDGSVQLSAPTGSVLTSDASSTADALVILGTENLASLSDLPHVAAEKLAIMGLKNIGDLNNELQLQVSQLSAKTVLGDINLGQIGDLLIADPLLAGGAVKLLGDSAITVDAKVMADTEVDFRTEGDTGVLSFLSGANLLSNQGSIRLHADRTLSTEIGSIIESSAGVSLSGGAAELGSEETHRMRLLGLFRGGPLQMLSGADGDSLQVAIADWIGTAGNPLEASLIDFSTLHLDDSHSSLGKNYVATNRRLESEVANLELGELQTLRMDLGSGSDSFRTEPSWQMNSLNINDSGGSNQYEFAGALNGQPKAISLSGGSDLEQLLIDGNGTPIWLAEGIVHVGDFEIQHSAIEKLLVENELSALRPEISNAVEIDHEAFPDNTLTLVGTAGSDDLFIDLSNPSTSLIGLWNETNDLRRDFESMDFDALRFILLDGDDSLLVDGSATAPLFVEGGPGSDWIQIETNSDTSVIDLSGNNVIKTASGMDTIRTGPGRDRIDAGAGNNEVHDSGGVNWIFAGSQNDQIYHANASDWIAAGQGVNDVWLNGSLVNWHNQSLRSDVNRDLRVSALDALTLINELQEVGIVNLEGSPNSTDDLYDTNDDRRLTAIDILVVINDLDRSSKLEGESISNPNSAQPPIADGSLASDEVFSTWEGEFDEFGSADRFDMIGLDRVVHQANGEPLSSSPDPAALWGVDELHETLESMHRERTMEALEDHFLALKMSE